MRRLAEEYPVALVNSVNPFRLQGQKTAAFEIVDALGEDYIHYDQRRLDTQMRRLRRKVEAASGLMLPVRTLRSVGYHFYADIELGN